MKTQNTFAFISLAGAFFLSSNLLFAQDVQNQILQRSPLEQKALIAPLPNLLVAELSIHVVYSPQPGIIKIQIFSDGSTLANDCGQIHGIAQLSPEITNKVLTDVSSLVTGELKDATPGQPVCADAAIISYKIYRGTETFEIHKKEACHSFYIQGPGQDQARRIVTRLDSLKNLYSAF